MCYNIDMSEGEQIFGLPKPSERPYQPYDFSVEEVRAAVSLDLANMLDIHQINDMKVYKTPTVLWPEGFEEQYPEAIEVLFNNTGSYDDELEDVIAQDTIVQEYIFQRRAEPDNQTIRTALLARRTILVRQQVNGDDGETSLSEAS